MISTKDIVGAIPPNLTPDKLDKIGKGLDELDITKEKDEQK